MRLVKATVTCWLLAVGAGAQTVKEGKMDLSPNARAMHRDKMVRLKSDRVFCELDTCRLVASFLLYRYVGLRKPVVLAYCETHAKEVARELGIEFVDTRERCVLTA